MLQHSRLLDCSHQALMGFAKAASRTRNTGKHVAAATSTVDCKRRCGAIGALLIT